MRISKDIELPTSVVTEPIGIFANRGFGKTWTAVDLVEELYAAGLPSVVLDIKGDWWGIRSSWDGKKDGLPFMIFGGEHADVPLVVGSGPTVARFIAEKSIPAIIDLSDLSKTKARRWAMEFAEALYDIKRSLRSPLMVVVDEADVLIPQRLSADLMPLLGAMEDIAKRGRQRGLGITVISQRVADVNKSVTDLLTTLILGNVTGVRTRKALMEWIDDHARSAAEVEQVLSSLSTLQPGEMWVWSPAFLKILQRLKIRRISTFDSHATPEPGEVMEMPRRMADIDINALSAELVETVEKVKADDPRTLRAERDRLVGDLATARIRETSLREQIENHQCVGDTVEVSVLTDDDRRRITEIYEGVVELAESFSGVEDAFKEVSQDVLRSIGQVMFVPPPRQVERSHRGGYISGSEPVNPPRLPTGPAPGSQSSADSDLTKAQRALLSALATHGPMESKRLGFVAGYAAGSGHFNNSIGPLRTRGYVDRADGRMYITPSGAAALGPVDPLPTGSGLIDYWKNKLKGKAAKTMFQVLVDAYPDPINAEELGQRSGYVAGTGHFNNTLGPLKSSGLVLGDRSSLVIDEAIGKAKWG